MLQGFVLLEYAQSALPLYLIEPAVI